MSEDPSLNDSALADYRETLEERYAEMSASYDSRELAMSILPDPMPQPQPPMPRPERKERPYVPLPPPPPPKPKPADNQR
jgi:hypothetical protein